MVIEVKDLVEALFSRLTPEKDTPLCYVEFSVDKRKNVYRNRIAVYRIEKASVRECKAYYKYVDDDNLPTGSIRNWNMHSPQYHVRNVLPMTTPSKRSGIVNKNIVPLLQVM